MFFGPKVRFITEKVPDSISEFIHECPKLMMVNIGTDLAFEGFKPYGDGPAFNRSGG